MSYLAWDEYLVHEHELIERAMDVLKRNLENLEQAAQEPRLLARALDFLLEFGDRLHNAKEELLLFPLLEERGVPRQGGPLGVMLAEHEAERALLKELAAELPGLAHAKPAGLESFRSRTLEYLQTRANHIWKENDVLYAMGRKVISDADNMKLMQGFAVIDAETYGDEALAHYEAMVQEMDGTGGKPLIENLSYAQLHAIMEALPVEVTFVDADDSVAYFNRLDKPKVFVRSRSVVGRKVLKCHPGRSAHKVAEIVEGFRARTLDKAEFWIDFRGEKILIRYFPVYGDDGKYMGVLEVTQEIGWIKQLEGQKRLL